MNYSVSEVALPSENHYFEMDNTTGKNYIVVIFSRQKLDIESIKGKMSRASGNASERVSAAVGNLVVGAEDVNLDARQISFDIAQSDSGKSAFAMIIEFNQVD